MFTRNHWSQGYRNAGSLADEISLLGFVNRTVFETKLGDLGMVLQLTGIDPECEMDERLDALTRRFESAMRMFDDRFRIYSYIRKRTGCDLRSRESYPSRAAEEAVERRLNGLRARADKLYTIDLFLVVMYEGFRPQSRFVPSLRKNRVTIAVDAERSIEILTGAVRSFISLLDDILGAVILEQRDSVAFFRSLFTFDSEHAAANAHAEDRALDSTVADAEVAIAGDHLEINDYTVKVISLKHLPAITQPNLLVDLLSVNAEMIVCAEWKPQSNYHMRRVIKGKQRGFDAMLVKFIDVAVHGRAVPKSEISRQHDVEEHYESLGECLKEIENRGRYFGSYSCTVVLLGKKLNEVREGFSSIAKVFGRWDAALIDERLNLFRAYLSIVPGNYKYNSRYQYLLNSAYANLALIWNSYTGNKRNEHLKDQYLCPYETSQQQVYYFNGHVGGVFGILKTGATGSGKSFDSVYQVAQLQKYDPITLILDIGGSYRDITEYFGGGYYEISQHGQASRMNPFALPETPDNLEFLFLFIRLLIGESTRCSPEERAKEDKKIYAGIEAMYRLDRKHRRLKNLILPAALQARLDRWCEGGQHGHVFDNEHDTVSFGNFTTFEFLGIDKQIDVLVPLCFYIQQRFDAVVSDPRQCGRLKVLMIDEAWRFLLNSNLGPYMIEKLKIGRKNQLANIFITQSALDAERAGPQFSELLNEACLIKMFFANPEVRQSTYQSVYGLNPKQAERIACLKPREELAIFATNPDRLSAKQFKVVKLKIDDVNDRLMMSNDPVSNVMKLQRKAIGA